MPSLGMIYVQDDLYLELMKLPKDQRSEAVQQALRQYFKLTKPTP